MSLKSYRQKRNFKKTLEPKGTIKSTINKNRYVIQKHAASHLHYDFRLELNGTLKSWAIPKGPSLDPNVKRLAVHVEDHPLEYGRFEGNIPKGQYGGGTVMLWDNGEWIPQKNDPQKQYQNGNLIFILKGKKLKGLWKLIRIKSTPKNWLLIKMVDAYSRSSDDYDILQKKSKSILSKKTIEQLEGNILLKKKNVIRQKKQFRHPKKTDFLTNTIKGNKNHIPHIIKPQLATLVKKPPIGNKWLHEIKFDGYRLITFIENKKVRLMTRGNKNWTSRFPNIQKELNKLFLPNSVFDGEVVLLDENQRSNFQLLQNAINDKKTSHFIYYVFDLIYYDGYDLSTLPLIERKRFLQEIIKDNKIIRYSDHVLGSGKEIFVKSCELSLEGIISKNIYSTYIQKRTHDWLKIKCIKRQEFVIGGYTIPNGKRKYFGSLLLGVYNKNKNFIYCGHVGTGFNETSLHMIYKELKKYTTKKMPFEKTPAQSKNAIWTKPILVVEVEFTEWTSDGILRHPSFKGLRSDKSPKSISIEDPLDLGKTSSPKAKKLKPIKLETGLTNSEKVLYPEQNITKLQLFEYYKHIQKWILPYIINRPLTLLRCPMGYQKECFYQKHMNQATSSQLKSILIKEKNKVENYIYIDNIDGLLLLPQLNVLEIHTWGSNINHIEKPDIITFDIDPAPDIQWKEVVKLAFEMKNQLQKFKLKSFVKTTGGKGLHVVVPINPEYSWDDIKIFTHTFVNYLVKLNPDKYIDIMTKSKRTGKIFIDYLRNQRGATTISPYSTRARFNAPVATPLNWNELTTRMRDTTYTLKTINNRLKKLKHDPWQDFFKIKQSLHLDKL